MKRQRLAFIVLGLVLALLVAVSGAAGSAQKGPGTHGKAQPNMDMRWDIVSLNLATSTLTRAPYSRASSSHVVWKEPISSAPYSVIRPLLNDRSLQTRPPT